MSMKFREMDMARAFDLLSYDLETGIFTWKKVLSRRCPVGSRAGSLHAKGYREIKFDGCVHRAARLAYAYVHGSVPQGAEIDHVNGVRDDDRILNLRPVTSSQNKQNQSKANSRSGTGVRGVFLNRRAKGPKKYVAHICVDRKKKHIGSYLTLAAAKAARVSAERKYHPFSPLNTSLSQTGDSQHG